MHSKVASSNPIVLPNSNEGTSMPYKCMPCQKRRLKCNQAFPGCNKCSKLGVECCYDSKPPRIRKPKDPKFMSHTSKFSLDECNNVTTKLHSTFSSNHSDELFEKHSPVSTENFEANYSQFKVLKSNIPSRITPISYYDESSSAKSSATLDGETNIFSDSVKDLAKQEYLNTELNAYLTQDMVNLASEYNVLSLNSNNDLVDILSLAQVTYYKNISPKHPLFLPNQIEPMTVLFNTIISPELLSSTDFIHTLVIALGIRALLEKQVDEETAIKMNYLNLLLEEKITTNLTQKSTNPTVHDLLGLLLSCQLIESLEATDSNQASYQLTVLKNQLVHRAVLFAQILALSDFNQAHQLILTQLGTFTNQEL